jgi:uncharacterized damage-inducible protein DinB
MSDLETLREWFAYNSDVRQGYVAALAKLSPDELGRDRGASFPTLLDILQHEIDGSSSWFARLAPLVGLSFRGCDRPDAPTLDNLRAYDRETAGHVQDVMGRLSETNLHASIVVKAEPPWWDQDFEAAVRPLLLHLVEEELQHRGELNALLWQIDVEPPILDWAEWASRRPVP